VDDRPYRSVRHFLVFGTDERPKVELLFEFVPLADFDTLLSADREVGLFEL
jgi:hypothetical protein